MTSPSFSRSILSRRDFRSRPIGKRNAAEIPPRARELLELMTFDDLSLEQAAERMGIKDSTAKLYFRHPRARAYYMSLLEQLRDRERARNIHTAIGIRDDGEMKKSAAGNRVRIEASRFIEGRDGPGGVTVNVGIQQTIQPGYAVSIPENYLADAHAVLRAAGSLASIDAGGERQEVEDVAPIAATVTEPSVQSDPASYERPRADWGGRPGPQAYPPADSRLRAPLKGE